MSWRADETFGELAAVRFGAAGDVGPVPLDDERELHRCGESALRSAGSRVYRRWRVRTVERRIRGEERRFERQLLDAGKQHVVRPALALEVVAAVLEQPAAAPA